MMTHPDRWRRAQLMALQDQRMAAAAQPREDRLQEGRGELFTQQEHRPLGSLPAVVTPISGMT